MGRISGLTLEAARESLASEPPPTHGPWQAAKLVLQRTLHKLIEERALHGHRSAAKIDLQLGRSEGYLGRVLRGEIGLQAEMLFRILYTLQVDPVAFFASVLGLHVDPRSCLQRLRRGLAETREKPTIALPRDLWRRLQRLSPGRRSKPSSGDASSDDTSSDDTSPDATSSGDTSSDPTLSDRLLDADERRFHDPRAAARSLADLLPRVLRQAEARPGDVMTRQLLARGLAVAASTERRHAAPRRAARLLDAALALMQAPHDSSNLDAEMLERAGYQLADQGDIAPALELARQATDRHLHLGNLAGVGRCFVLRAVVAFHRGDSRAAAELYAAALRYLPPGAWQNRFTAWQGMGLCHLQLGDIDQADACAQQAESLHLSGQGLHWWRLRWLQAEIAFRQQNLERAERLYRQCQGAFDDANLPLDVAQLALHLTKVLLAARKMHQVRTVAAGCMALHRPLRRHGEARALLEDLARRALTCELSSTWLDKAAQQLDRDSLRCLR